MCAHVATCQLDCSIDAVPRGRHFVGERLTEWVPSEATELRDDVLLAASELLGNAARYCTGDMGLTVLTLGNLVLVAVTDDSPEPARLRPPTLWDSSGRGLALVDQLVVEWGQDAREGTKTVWFVVSLGSHAQHEAPPSRLRCDAA